MKLASSHFCMYTAMYTMPKMLKIILFHIVYTISTLPVYRLFSVKVKSL